MTQDGGDNKFGTGDEITVVNADGGELAEGDLVYISGYDGDYPEVESADADGDTGYHGVVAKGGDDGDYLSVIGHGTPWVRVSTDVSAGDTPAAADSTVSGEEAATATDGGDGDDVFLTDAETLQDGNDYAVIHIK